MSTPLSPSFAGQKVLITGASQGIGEATAFYFAERGARVALNGRKIEKLRAVQAKLPKVPEGPHVLAPGNVGIESDVRELMARAIAELGGLDILVCNAGFQIESPSEKLSYKDFEAVMGVNVGGTVLCSVAALQHWLKENHKGVIVVNSSVHQLIPKPGFLGYSASKGALGNVVKTLALEYADRGIRINAVGPGAIVTPINESWINDPEKYAAVCNHIPMHRPGSSEEIAEVIGFLASSSSTYITGQTLYVDGGLTLYADFAKNWSS